MAWKYVPDPNRKHKKGWQKNFVGFIEKPKGSFIGKCPTNLTTEQAEKLLNTGIEFSPPDWKREYPERIYNIHDGVLYRATATNPGESYHGFPEHPTRAQKLPKVLKERILKIAEHHNCLEEIKRWLKT